MINEIIIPENITGQKQIERKEEKNYDISRKM